MKEDITSNIIRKRYGRLLLTCLMICVSLVAVSNAQNVKAAQQENLNDIRFDEKSWDPNLLNIIERGPSILPADTEFTIDAPPLNDSEITRKELDYLREIEKTKRDPETLKRIVWETDGVEIFSVFIQEGLLLEGENPKTLSLMRMVDNDHKYFILKYKQQFKRPRPSILAPDLELSIINPGHPAYPSGHASQAYMAALILSYFDPENNDRYFKLAYDIAHRREIAGVHYPSDSETGRQFAQQVFDAFMAIPTFKKKMDDARLSYVKPPYVAVDLYPKDDPQINNDDVEKN